jgi:NAD(P)-dependent dehydrogenase (short-subunit alcohol dehydrogenase family)
MKIKGAVALVTGANRGIGGSMVDALLAGGASRIYAAIRTPSSAAREEKVVPIALKRTTAIRKSKENWYDE